ncbi:serine/threonine protein kinase, partial [Salinispora arenicola]|uniref:serine/threonine protein kinase n=1 Tax=Salinispora arenicola TaxID=168697 RepID=UPI001E48F797
FHDRFEVHPDCLIAELRAWWRASSREAGRLSGNIGLFLLTLICLRYSESVRTGVEADEHDCRTDCQALVAAVDVQRAIHRIYKPGGFPTDLPSLGNPEQQTNAEREWAGIDPTGLRFHQHGTTSFILAGSTALTRGHHAEFALKCLLYPYLRIPAIARATISYQKIYGVESGELEHLSRIWASGDSWILMDFIHGDQLDVYLSARLAGQKSRPGLRLDLLEELGTGLLSALEELERHGHQHGDLSMTNILVNTDRGRLQIRLIDLGPNYLHTQRIPGHGGGTQYVAPEVRSNSTNLRRADIYSLGQLLINFAGTSSPVDGTIPDDFYSEAPLLARLLEDLIDEKPSRRLIVFQPAKDKLVYSEIKSFFIEEIAAVRATDRANLTHPHSPWYMHLRELVRPLSGVPAEQRRLWEFRRQRDQVGHLRWLRWWGLAGSYSFFVAASIIVMFWTRDLGLSWDNRVIEIVNRITGSDSDRIPLLDDLRAADYPIADAWGSLPARLVCLSFAFACAKYYQNLFAGLTPLATSKRDRPLRRRAVIAEVAMRQIAVVGPILTLIPTLFGRNLWPICTAIGITTALVSNVGCAQFTRAALIRATDAGLTTVPREPGNPTRPDVPGAKEIVAWSVTSAFYAVICWTIGLLINIGTLQDVLMYATACSAINMILFYIIRCGVNARYVRAGLVRSCLAAERLDRIERLDRPSPPSTPNRPVLPAGNSVGNRNRNEPHVRAPSDQPLPAQRTHPPTADGTDADTHQASTPD